MAVLETEPRRAALTRDFLRYALAAAAVTPRTLLSVARGRVEPEIPERGDFGRMRSGTHEVVAVGDLETLQQTLRQARAGGQRVTCSGSRHSANGQTLPPDGGLQLRLDRDSGRWTAPTMVDEEHVRVSAAHTWATLQSYLIARGRSCPVLTDHLTTTIGGTLSVGGGIGTSSVAYGRQLDNVTEFFLVRPDGERVRCAPDENPRLFRHVMGGMGELGVMDEVTMRTRVFRPYLAVFAFQARTPELALRLAHSVLTHPERPENLTHMVIEGPILNTGYNQIEFGFEFDQLAEATALVREPPEALAALHPWRRVLTARSLVAGDRSNDRHNRSARYVASLTDYRHLWNDFLFADFEALTRFVRFAQDQVFPRHGNRHLLSGLSFAYPGDPLDPVDPDHRRAAFSFPYQASDGLRWSFGFNYSVPEGPAVETTVAALTELREEATRLGAGVYGYGYDTRTRQDFERAYGPIVGDFVALKREVDPDGLFGGGLKDDPRSWA